MDTELLEIQGITSGRKVGKWTILDQCIITEGQEKKWLCRSDSGEERYVSENRIRSGKSLGCGSIKHGKNAIYADITGRRFGHLVAEHRTSSVGQKVGVIWHCRCDCGSELDVPYNTLMYGNQISCGCVKKEWDQMLGKLLTHVDGTSLDIIKSTKLPSDNTTGYKGVYLKNGKYLAKIFFRGKPYFLGYYKNIEDAVKARKEGEEALYSATIEYHARWKAKADTEPEWAALNPIQIFVTKENGRLQISFLPNLDAVND